MRKFGTAKIIIAILTPLLLVAYLAIAYFTNNSVAKTINSMTTKQPERVSELYFNDSLEIPKKLRPNHIYKAGFTITNREYRRRKYSYKAIYFENRSQKIISKGELSLNNNESKTLQVHFKPAKPKTTVRVVIKILNSNQKIGFRAST